MPPTTTAAVGRAAAHTRFAGVSVSDPYDLDRDGDWLARES
jgi:hypothetical protein